MLRLSLLAMAAAIALGTASASAHDQELRPGENFPPRVGRMSDEVIVQRLRLDGVENARIVRRDGNTVRVQGMRAGRALQLEVEALTGKVFDVSTPNRRLMIGGAVAPQRPIIVGPQISVARERLADPQLMNDVTERIRTPPRRPQ